MRIRDVWMVGAAWAAGTVALGWIAGDIQLAVLIATLSFILLVLFMGLWEASRLLGAALTFGATSGLIVLGALVFALWSRWVGGALMISSGVVFGWLGYWNVIRWGKGCSVQCQALRDEPEEHHLGHEGWGGTGPVKGKAVPDLPGVVTDAPLYPFWEFGAINPNAGRRDV